MIFMKGKHRKIPYASAVGSLMYVMLCTRLDICFAVGVVSRFQSNHGPEHWIAVKHVLKYLRRTRNLMLTVPSSPKIVKNMLNTKWVRRQLARAQSPPYPPYTCQNPPKSILLCIFDVSK